MTIWCGKCGGRFASAAEFSAHGCAIRQQPPPEPPRPSQDVPDDDDVS